MNPYDGQAEVIETIEQRLATPDLDAETLGRTVLMLEWFAESGLLVPEAVDQLLAERMVGAPA